MAAPGPTNAVRFSGPSMARPVTMGGPAVSHFARNRQRHKQSLLRIDREMADLKKVIAEKKRKKERYDREERRLNELKRDKKILLISWKVNRAEDRLDKGLAGPTKHVPSGVTP